jgi:quinol-cytochrome oxidoreductase complex cytochrome b subunit
MKGLSVLCVLPLLLAGAIAMIVVHVRRKEVWWLAALWGATVICAFTGVLAAGAEGGGMVALIGLVLGALTTVALVFEIRSIRKARAEERAASDAPPIGEA